MFDLDAYLQRIGLTGRASLAEIHRAHSCSIPFENLDPHRGVEVSLAVEDLFEKLVLRRRGGYCFEQNLLLAGALQELGLQVELFLARVRYGAPPGVIRPRGHLLLRVDDGQDSWHCDVGFGLGTLFEPIPFGPGSEQHQFGWCYRVIEDGPEHVLQQKGADGWADVYAYLPNPNPPIDVETINWWVCTHPHSPFVSGLVAGIQDRHGKRSVLNNWSGELALIERTPAGESTSVVSSQTLPQLLAQRFGLSGFELDAQGRPVPIEDQN
ncbi:MAG: arylamine N-acetyltransferase family protein [Solirubrobacteraceae bacterium]